MKLINSTMAGSALLLAAGSAVAATAHHDINTTITYPASPGFDINDAIVGSDTLNGVMDALLLSMSGTGDVDDGGYNIYLGLGSSVGERQLVGGTANASEPQCAPSDSNLGAENNPGCLEISPMSREMGGTICDDDHDNVAGTGGWTGTNTEAEGLGFCKDGLVMITDNISLGQYGNSAAGGSPNCADYGWAGTGGLSAGGTSNSGNSYPDRGVGNLRSSGTLDIAPVGPGAEDYTIGGGTLTAGNEWKDVLRLIYTGCDNNDGTCAGANDRVARCGGTIRTTLLANWSNIFQGDQADCGAAGNNCSTGLRKAYRRDDASGTTGFFLEILGVAANVATNLASRTQVAATLDPNAFEAMKNNLSFCDGGHHEGWFPTNYTGTTPPTRVAKFDLGDPIRKNCRSEDDLCAYDKKMPVVRAIRSTFTPVPEEPLSGFPKYQCSPGRFARMPYVGNSALPVCPDGTRPSLAGCNFPYYTTDGGVTRNFDCLNSEFNVPLSASTADGRSYNFVMHETNGTVRKQTTPNPGSIDFLPQVASWRENMAELDIVAAVGYEFGNHPTNPTTQGRYVCREVDATRTIGCVVGKTICTVGYAGREAAFSTANDYHLYNDPFKIVNATPSDTSIDNSSYKMARYLWLNATHGFENLTDDCEGRGGSTLDCENELAIATEIWNATNTPGNRVGDICVANGFVAIEEPLCKGATESAGCGAPTTQNHEDCEPF